MTRLINTEKCAGACAHVSVYAGFWGSSLQMDWALTGIPMSCYDGVMKSLPLTKTVFTLRRRLAVLVCVCVQTCTLIAPQPSVAWRFCCECTTCRCVCTSVRAWHGEGAVHQQANEGELTQVHEKKGGEMISPTQIWDEVWSHNQTAPQELIQSYRHMVALYLALHLLVSCLASGFYSCLFFISPPSSEHWVYIYNRPTWN